MEAAAVFLNHILLAGLVYPWADSSIRQRDLPRYIADVLQAALLSMVPWLVHGLNYSMLAAMWVSLVSWTRVEDFMGNWKHHTLADVGAWPKSLVIAASLAVLVVLVFALRSPSVYFNMVVLAVGAVFALIQWLSCHLAVLSDVQLHIHHYQVGFLLSLLITHPLLQGAFLGAMLHGLLHYGGDSWIEIKPGSGVKEQA